MDGDSQIGKISKEYSGFVTEMFTKADRFSISCKKIPYIIHYLLIVKKTHFILLVPIDLSVKTKATLFGALFLIVNFDDLK